MTDYRPILYHKPLSLECVRVRRAIRELQVEVQLKDVLLSRQNRAELSRLLEGKVRVPCLVLPNTVISDKTAILRYLQLRYGR